MATVRKVRIVGNPNKTGRGAKRARQNPGLLYTIGRLAANPKEGTMKKAKKNKKPARRRNPLVIFSTSKKKTGTTRRARRNPSVSSVARKPLDMVKTGLYALLGILAARQIPQAVLGEKNKGAIGYGSNAAAALVASFAAGKTLGRDAAQAVGVGGMAYVVSRILTEQFSPMGKMFALSGLSSVGDPMAAAPRSLGKVMPWYFPVPVQRNADGSPKVEQFQPIVNAALAQMPQPKPAPVQGSISGVRRSAAR